MRERIDQLSTPILATMIAGLVAWTAYENVINREFRAKGDRWTVVQAHAQTADMKRWVREEFPPSDLLLRVERLEREVCYLRNLHETSPIPCASNIQTWRNGYRPWEKDRTCLPGYPV